MLGHDLVLCLAEQKAYGRLVARMRQEVVEELVVADLQTYRLANECETLTELQQKFLHVSDKLRLKLTLVPPVGHREKIEDVGIFGGLLSQVGVVRRQGRRKCW